jgi:HAD superfamily hydrolase (TIGR01509 family)
MFNEFYKISQAMYDTTICGFPNARETILKLKKDGIRMGVVTNKVRGPAYRVLKLINLDDDIFDIVIGFDDVKNGKPSPEGINKALEVLGYTNKEKVLYIGDNPIDDLTAKNAGVDSCICYWGPRKMPNDLNPTYKIYSYPELLEKIKL